MHLLRTNFNGNPNIGLLGIATEKYCIIGSDLSRKKMKEIKDALKVPVINTTICGTELAGVFCAANSNCLLLPDIVFDNELAVLKKHKIRYKVIETRHTALGNNILCNDNGCVLSREFSKSEAEKIRTALKVDAVKGTVGGLDVVGSSAVANSKGCLAHEDIKKEEKRKIEKVLNTRCETGTMNMGSPFVKSGIIANGSGLVASKSSGGPEIANADEALGFI